MGMFNNPGMLLFHVAIAGLMVATGTINTLAAKWADILRAMGYNPKAEHVFDHPYFQAAEMFLGEMSCIFAFTAWFYYKKCRRQDMKEFGPQKFIPVVWAIPAMCDLLGTSTMYVGLTWTYAASFQMLRGSVIIFTGLLSVVFLGTQLKTHHWIGMKCVFIGLVLVGKGDIIYTNESGGSSHYVLAGDLLIVLAQAITAVQMTVEEKLIKKYKVPPLQAVGWEGIFGFSVLTIALIPMFFIPWHLPHPPSVWQEHVRFEDAIDAFYMLGNNWRLLFAAIGTVISIAFFNFAGLTVTSTMNATTRMVLDSVRTIFIWVFSLAIGWQQFQPLQPVGYFVLLVGTCIYYDIIIMPAFRYLRRKICYSGQYSVVRSSDLSSSEEDDEKRPILEGSEITPERKISPKASKSIQYSIQPSLDDLVLVICPAQSDNRILIRFLRLEHFGVAVQLSKFTLSKLVVVTPYYILANQLSTDVMVMEDNAPGEGVIIPKTDLIPFWPLTDSNHLSLKINDSITVKFCYKNTDSIVLQLNSIPTAVCVDIQETGSADLISISPYYEGCVPVNVVNLFPNYILMFKQDKETKGSNATQYLQPGESVMYTWEDPCSKRVLKWGLKGVKMSHRNIDVSKDGKESFNINTERGAGSGAVASLIVSSRPGNLGSGSSLSSSTGDSWLSVSSDENLTESLVTADEKDTDQGGRKVGFHMPATPITRGHWISYLDGLQRVLVFTHDEGIVDRIKAADGISRNILELSVAVRSVGLSLVDNIGKKEVAYIGVMQSGVIWQVARKKGHWKTLNNTVIAILEDAYQSEKLDIRQKDLVVNIEAMEMFVPLRGRLRRTNFEGVEIRAAVSENERSLNAKIGYVQIDNQLPFSIFPQMFYPLPPPPTVASTIEPKPFVEASVIIRKTEQKNVNHFKYFHVLVQRMSINVDLKFLLALLDLLRTSNKNELLEAQYVLNDVEYSGKNLKEIVQPAASDEAVKRNFFDVLHVSPVKVTLSFSFGNQKLDQEGGAGERFLQLLFYSLGVIPSSVQEAQMNFSLFHLEYIAVTWSRLIDLFIKHYRTQGLVHIHTIVLGLDVLGNPVNVVRGVVEGTFDLFYEPIKGSVLGPEEFAEGLGIGLKSFFGGTVGGITGAGARITGAFGDVFAKLSFDTEYIDRRQQDKAKSTRMGSKFGGFFKNVAEGVTRVVAQPIKGVKEEGALGFFKGTGKGLVGLLVRPTGGLIDLTSGALDFVTKKTKVGDVDILQIRPPRYISREGHVTPYNPHKAIGKALLQGTDEGKFTSRKDKKNDYYVEHLEISKKPLKFLIVTDRRYMIIEQSPLIEGWKSSQQCHYKHLKQQSSTTGSDVLITEKSNKAFPIVLSSESMAVEASQAINKGYMIYTESCGR